MLRLVGTSPVPWTYTIGFLGPWPLWTPALISRTVSVDIKNHVYYLASASSFNSCAEQSQRLQCPENQLLRYNRLSSKSICPARLPAPPCSHCLPGSDSCHPGIVPHQCQEDCCPQGSSEELVGPCSKLQASSVYQQ